jgi:hypothetical protein
MMMAMPRHRVTVLILMAALALSLLAGCSMGQKPTSDTPGKQAAPDTRDRSKDK